MNYWLVKTEKSAFSYDDLEKNGRTDWDGVRNYQARNNLKAMETGDLSLIYHSVNDREVVGIAKITSSFYQDPTTDDDRWVAVEMKPHQRLKKCVSLKEIKATPELENIALVKHSRLSVMPLEKEAFDKIVAMSEEG